MREILKKEREAREMLMRENELWLKDSVMRSYGLLKYAAKMNTEEAMNCLSFLLLGVSMECSLPAQQLR